MSEWDTHIRAHNDMNAQVHYIRTYILIVIAWAYQRCFFLCTRERALFGFIRNSCCVESSYHCCMAYLALFGISMEC